jgi:hypothetical protein
MHQGAFNGPGSRGPGRPKQAASGHAMATTDDQVSWRDGLQAAVAGQIAIAPRLLSLDAAAAYLSMSPWTGVTQRR